MTDLTIFRIYEPHELKDGRYPHAWYDTGDGRGIKDIVREEAGHRCVRCGHPYRKGESATWEMPDGTTVKDERGVELQAMLDLDVESADHYIKDTRATLWSDCDENCTHGEAVRWRDPRQNEWTEWSRSPSRPALGQVAEPGELAKRGFIVQAAWRILTVHHLNERKFDCRWHNLVSLCQRCHLVIQRKVEMNQVWPFEHSDWFKPYAAGFYAYSYRGVELTRAEVDKDLDELLSLERVA